MLTGRGYVCVLSGIAARDELPALSRNATIQRSLWAWGLDDQSISSPGLFDNPLQWLRPPETPPFPPPKGKIAAVLHLYYTDLWPELAAFLRQIPYPFDLWITHCGMDARLQAGILGHFPGARIIQVENRGRDIWPFISLLNSGAFEKYDCVCKIHSKKSAHKPGQEESLLGSRWRRRALYDLLAAGRAWQIVDMFERDPSLGIVGPAVLRTPNSRYSADMAWGTDKNRELTMRLARRTGMVMDETGLDFFAGSMFWVRPKALEPIRQLNLQRSDFPDEAGQLDGETQHAVERIFFTVARYWFQVADVRPLEILEATSGCGEGT
jgi:lipopolysaccharide biosynthesis protein